MNARERRCEAATGYDVPGRDVSCWRRARGEGPELPPWTCRYSASTGSGRTTIGIVPVHPPELRVGSVVPVHPAADRRPPRTLVFTFMVSSLAQDPCPSHVDSAGPAPARFVMEIGRASCRE